MGRVWMGLQSKAFTLSCLTATPSHTNWIYSHHIKPFMWQTMVWLRHCISCWKEASLCILPALPLGCSLGSISWKQPCCTMLAHLQPELLPGITTNLLRWCLMLAGLGNNSWLQATLCEVSVTYKLLLPSLKPIHCYLFRWPFLPTHIVWALLSQGALWGAFGCFPLYTSSHPYFLASSSSGPNNQIFNKQSSTLSLCQLRTLNLLQCHKLQLRNDWKHQNIKPFTTFTTST